MQRLIHLTLVIAIGLGSWQTWRTSLEHVRVKNGYQRLLARMGSFAISDPEKFHVKRIKSERGKLAWRLRQQTERIRKKMASMRRELDIQHPTQLAAVGQPPNRRMEFMRPQSSTATAENAISSRGIRPRTRPHKHGTTCLKEAIADAF